LAFLGAVSLPLYHRVWLQGWRTAATDPELRGLLTATVLVATLTAGLAVHAGSGWGEALWHGTLIGVSAQTGTGFTTLEPPRLGAPAQLALIVAMLVGGGIGSTTGGIKILRLLILGKLLRATLQRTAVPAHAVITPRLGNRALEPDDLIRALGLAALFATLVLLSWLVFLAHGYPPLPALFEVASAVGTVGLTAGLTRPELEPALKAVLCFDMIAGRLEIIALLVVLYPRTWLGRRNRTR
ncbi:MAG TPA: potassium transporter TrkG, partial [Gammaproteobacteria bacterium]|nr:potassium transporter TrkG [Gammaproteobacteria bacterium]